MELCWENHRTQWWIFQHATSTGGYLMLVSVFGYSAFEGQSIQPYPARFWIFTNQSMENWEAYSIAWIPCFSWLKIDGSTMAAMA